MSAPAYAADENGRFVTEGPGRSVCKNAFAPGQDPERVNVLAGWLTGYLSAANQFLPETFDLTPWHTPGTLLALVQQYCRSNPDKTVVDGAQHLVRFLAPTRLKTEARVVTLGEGSRRVVLYDVVVEDARAKLAEAGHPAGPSLEELAVAIRRYQAANDLPETGLLDQRTLAFLFE